MRAASACVVASLFLATVVAQQPQQPPPSQSPPRPAEQVGTATIAGRIVAAESGTPIRGAVLRLVSYEVQRVARPAVTDVEGRFEYTGLVAGQYQLLEATADGYLTMRFGQRAGSGPAGMAGMEAGKPIDLREGERFGDANIALPRRSALEGTVVDEFGDPAPNIQMLVSQVQFVIGSHRLMPGTGAGVTDDKGRYRITNLAPGDYYVSASGGAFTTANAPGGFAVTYYPGSADAGLAKPVRVPIGREVSGISFPLVAAQTNRISGTIVDDAGRPIQSTVLLATRDFGVLSAFSVARTEAKADGTFLFRNVPPGSYVVQGFGPPQGGGNLGRSPFASVPVTLDGRDRSDVVLRVRPGSFARGTIVLERSKPATPITPADVRVAFGPIEFDRNPVMGGPADMVTNENWTFSAANQFGLRALRVDLRAADWAVKRATLDGRDVTDAAFDFGKGDVNGLEIVLTDAVSSIGGTVVDEDRQPAGSYSVVLFSTDSAKWKFPSRFIQLARPNQDGRFKASGLPPDDYFVVALPAVQGGEWQDPQFLEKLKLGGLSVTVAEGESRVIELRLTRHPD